MLKNTRNHINFLYYLQNVETTDMKMSSKSSKSSRSEGSPEIHKGQKKFPCSHISASWDPHHHCKSCRLKGLGPDACVAGQPCSVCSLFEKKVWDKIGLPENTYRERRRRSIEHQARKAKVLADSLITVDKTAQPSSSSVHSVVQTNKPGSLLTGPSIAAGKVVTSNRATPNLPGSGTSGTSGTVKRTTKNCIDDRG